MVYRRIVITLLILASLLPGALSTAQESPDFAALITAEQVMAHVEALAVDIGARPLGSEAEAEAADYIAGSLEEWGYDVEIQEFETYTDESNVTSRNVIATLAGDEEVLVVGAHMDSVTDGTGAGDNASGVAAMLAVAEVLSEMELVHTVVFVAFGAEEGDDLSGAGYYVEQLGDTINNVIAMINLDGVGMGTDLNVYAGAVVSWPDGEEYDPEFEGGPVWVRDLALDLADEMGLPFGTTPDESWGGFIHDWSDHYAFVVENVPIAYFDTWDWEEAEDLWWGQETPEGDVMHTPDDVYDNIEPEKVEMTAELVAATAAAILTGAADTE